jgi:hypothetical protein
MPYREGDPTVEIEGWIEVTTAKAYLIHPTMGPKDQVWVPKSQIVSITDKSEDGNSVFKVTLWWYNQAGLGDED